MQAVSIYWLVLRRVLLTAAGVALLVVPVVLYFAGKGAENAALSLAMANSAEFRRHVAERGTAHLADLELEARKLLARDFARVAVYGPDKSPVLDITATDKEPLAQAAGRHLHDFPEGVYGDSHALRRGGELMVQVLVALRGRGGKNLGYFEGLYQVPPPARVEVDAATVRSAVIALVIVFVTATVLYPVIIALNRSVLGLSADLVAANLELLETLGNAVAKRDSDTDEHNYRVCLYAIRFAEELGLTHEQIQRLTVGAFLHDVGKIGISDNILLKPGKLTEPEFESMRQHVRIGGDIIAGSRWLARAKDVVLFHHEHYDGSGYLQGLKGDRIPLSARLFAIIDVFDALTSKRPYKEPVSVDAALKLMQAGRASHFDPKLLDVFVKLVPQISGLAGRLEAGRARVLLRRLLAKYFLADQASVPRNSRIPRWLAKRGGMKRKTVRAEERDQSQG